MQNLLVAALFFVGTHVGISSTNLRAQLIERVGENGYRLLYSLVALVAIVWLITAYNAAPYVPLPYGNALTFWAPHVLLAPAFLLIVGGLTGPNPTSVGQRPDPDAAEPARGVVRITRHPFMWGVGLWGVAHLLANPDLAAFTFFGAIALLALGGAWTLDRRRTKEADPGWGVFLQSTSYVPFGAIAEGRNRLVWREIGWWRPLVALVLYVALIYLHSWLFGVGVLH